MLLVIPFPTPNTQDHPFSSVEHVAYGPARQLEPGDHVLLVDGTTVKMKTYETISLGNQNKYLDNLRKKWTKKPARTLTNGMFSVQTVLINIFSFGGMLTQ